jgi:adenosylcobinamide-GDP ribazoletransferase
LADVCDAFGGGWSREQILTILKDSRLGTYGVVGLTLALGLKVALLASLPSGAFFPAVMVGHTLSRAFAASFTYWLPYAREEADYGKAKPLAKGMPLTRLLTLLALGVLPLGLLPFGWLWLAPLALVPVGVYLYRLYRRWLGGYTGDCLGAAQQLGELALYLALAALPWF